MAAIIEPSANGVGGTPLTKEQAVTSLLVALMGRNFVLNGFAVPGSSPNLNLGIGIGAALIDGHHCSDDAAQNALCIANQTNHIFLKLLKDVGNNASGLQIEVNLTGVPPADSVYLATAVCTSSSISSTTDQRIFTFAKGLKWAEAISEDELLDQPIIGRTKLKTATVSMSGTLTASSLVDITYNPYAFMDHFHATIARDGYNVPIGYAVRTGHSINGASADLPRFGLLNPGTQTVTYQLAYRYMTN